MMMMMMMMMMIVTTMKKNNDEDNDDEYEDGNKISSIAGSMKSAAGTRSMCTTFHTCA